MNTISSENTIQSILEYMDPRSALHMGMTEVRMKRVLDNHPKWNEIAKKAKPKPSNNIIMNNSLGLSALIIRNSLKKWTCISCGEHCDNPFHPFYGILVCKDCCLMTDVFRTVGVKEACKLFFMEEEDTIGVPKHYKTSVNKIMTYWNAKICGERRNGVLGLKALVKKRDTRRLNLSRNRRKALDIRIIKLKNLVWNLATESFTRIDAELMDCTKMLKLMHRHRLGRIITGDIFQFKLKSKFSPEKAATRLFEFVCMLSFCRKNGIIYDNHYTPTLIHKDFQIYSVFLKHLQGGKHFYVSINEYVESLNVLERRALNIDSFIMKNKENLNEESRKEMVIKICVEEGIPMREEVFKYFIEEGIGNPVLIARSDRKMGFLIDRGLYDEITYYRNGLHMSQENAEMEARLSILRQFGGFPIFNNIFTDDSITPLYI